MFIKTKFNELVNADNINSFKIIKSLNTCNAEIVGYGNKIGYEIFSGTIQEVEEAYKLLIEGLAKGASLISYKD